MLCSWQDLNEPMPSCLDSCIQNTKLQMKLMISLISMKFSELWNANVITKNTNKILVWAHFQPVIYVICIWITLNAVWIGHLHASNLETWQEVPDWSLHSIWAFPKCLNFFVIIAHKTSDIIWAFSKGSPMPIRSWPKGLWQYRHICQWVSANIG
jgi:hypothetical protein